MSLDSVDKLPWAGPQIASRRPTFKRRPFSPGLFKFQLGILFSLHHVSFSYYYYFLIFNTNGSLLWGRKCPLSENNISEFWKDTVHFQISFSHKYMRKHT